MDRQLRFVHDLALALQVGPGRTIRVERDFDPGFTNGLTSKGEARARLAEGAAILSEYEDRLAAEMVHGVLQTGNGGSPHTDAF